MWMWEDLSARGLACTRGHASARQRGAERGRPEMEEEPSGPVPRLAVVPRRSRLLSPPRRLLLPRRLAAGHGRGLGHTLQAGRRLPPPVLATPRGAGRARGPRTRVEGLAPWPWRGVRSTLSDCFPWFLGHSAQDAEAIARSAELLPNVLLEPFANGLGGNPHGWVPLRHVFQKLPSFRQPGAH